MYGYGQGSLVAQLVKNMPAIQETLVWFLGWEDPWRRDKLPTPVFLGFPGGSDGKESTCNAGDLGSIPGSGRSAGEGIGYSLQYSWASLVAQTVKNLPAMWETWVWSLGWVDPLEKAMDAHSSIPAWKFHGLYSPWDHKKSDKLSAYRSCTVLDTENIGLNKTYSISSVRDLLFQ